MSILSCWQPVKIGAAIVKDEGATIVIPLETPAKKRLPVVSMVIVMTVVIVIILIMIPTVVTLVGIVIDVSALHS